MKNKNYKIDSRAGNNFTDLSEKAKKIAAEKQVAVEFEFNGIICLVNSTTNLDWLWRDYGNAHRMEWKTVGADCLPKYDKETQKELDKRNKSAQIKYAQQQKEWKEKEDKERAEFSKKVKGVSIELKDVKGWEKTVNDNTDPYGKAAIDYAEGWAKLMQIEISKGKTLIECAENTSHELGFLGITGFMYGCAVNILSQCWKYGEDLRKWHNKEYDHEGDGVVNPAVLTISS